MSFPFKLLEPKICADLANIFAKTNHFRPKSRKNVFRIALEWINIKAVKHVLFIVTARVQLNDVNALMIHGLVCDCRNIYLAFLCDNTLKGIRIDMATSYDSFWATLPLSVSLWVEDEILGGRGSKFGQYWISRWPILAAQLWLVMWFIS